MKRLIVATATTLFMASAGAGHVYGEFGAGNSDLSLYNPAHDTLVGVQPGVGDSVDIYRDFAEGNSDLFSSRDRGGSNIENQDKQLPRIYTGFESGNSDLSW